MTAGGPAEALLEAADGLARIGTDDAVRGAGVEALSDKALLQLQALRTAERLLATRPTTRYLAFALEALGQQPDGQRVGRGVVVTQDRAEIVHDQECRTTVSGWQQQGGIGFVSSAGQAA